MSIVSGCSLVGGHCWLVERMMDWGYYEQCNGNLDDAVALYQKNYSVEIDRYARRLYGGENETIGKIGPATAAVMNSRHCNVSDFQVGEPARWPDECVNSISVSWNFGSFPGASSEETDDAWRSLSTYDEHFQMRLVLTPDEYPSTRIFAALKALPGSTLAWSFLANNNCRFRAQQAYDSTISWRSRTLRVGTIRHEVGHALGMQHTPRDPESVMYPSMRGQFELNKTDIAQMLRLGYKRRVEAPDPPSPKPDGRVSAVVRVDEDIYQLVQKNPDSGGWWP